MKIAHHPAPRVEAPPVAGRNAPTPGSVAAILLLGLFLIAFVVQAAPHIAAPFGDNHDGRNGSTWASASDAVRSEGPLDSRFGAVLTTGETYAHHPPLIIAETVAAEAPFGEHAWATRLPAWLGSVAVVVLLATLLFQRGLPLIAVAGGVVIALSSQMFLLFGPLLDTLQTSLPFALGLYLVWDRHRSEPTWPVTLLAALTALASWESALMVLVLVAIDIVRSDRRDPRSLLRLPTVRGLIIGVTLTVAWLWWASGSLSEIVDQFAVRTGTEQRSWGFSEWLDVQSTYLRDLLSPMAVVFGVVGAWCAARDRRAREPFLVFLGVTVAYPLLLSDGALHHDYWNYWLTIPLAISVTALFAAVVERASDPVPVIVGIVAIALLGLALSIVQGSAARTADTEGRAIAEDFARAAQHGNRPIRHEVGMVTPARWTTAWGPEVHAVSGPPDARRRAVSQPNERVFVRCPPYPSWVDAVCRGTTANRETIVVTMEELAATSGPGHLR